MKVAGNIFMQSWIGEQLKEAYSGFFINPEKSDRKLVRRCIFIQE